MVYYLQTGQYLPLNCFLDGEEEDKTIRAKVYGSAGQLIGQATLVHLQKGYYHNVSALQMPSDTILVAIYEIYDDPGMTLKSVSYTTVIDQFMPAVSGKMDSTSMALDASRELIGLVEIL